MNEPTTVSVTDYARTVLTARKVEGLRDHEGDAGRCRVYLEGTPLGAMALAEVRRKHVRDWLTATLARHAIVGGKASERLVAASTAQNALNIVRVVFSRAVEDEIIETSPAAEVKLPKGIKVQRPARAWTVLRPAEITALLAVMTGELRMMFVVAIHTGLRLSELLYLRWSDVRLDVARPHILVTRGRKGGPTKSGKPRTVPLLQQPLDVLRALPKPSDASAIIFPSVRGGAQSKSGYRRAWHIAFAEAKIAKRPGLGWHVTRHTAATGLLGGWFTGAPAAIKDVQAVLGHSTVIMTEKYAKILDEDLLTRVGARNDNAVEPPPDTERELPAAPDTQRDLDECGEEAAAE